MSKHEIWFLQRGKWVNLTPLVTEISWRSNIDELGTELNFSVAYGDAIDSPKKQVDVGEIVILKSGNFEITRCIVTEENLSGRDPISYKAFDFAFYLNKSKRVYQFNEMSATKAINKICSNANIPIGEIAKINTKIDKIYFNESLSDMIKDILSQVQDDTGTKYLFEMRYGKFYLFKAKDMVVKPKYSNIIISPNRRHSIEEMKNSIQVTSDGKLLAAVGNRELIERYGTLVEIVDIQEEDKSKARNIAANKLKELGRVLEECSIETLGDNTVLAGRIISITEPLSEIKGDFMIKSVQHNVKNGLHTMSLNLTVKGV
ncbi:XkdQ/YqbQ family protein [Metabacillus litoralis]|uniref:XkdQ/YqbQ family protein n=1 Tax=Metabacillus litoralis TaxID=152268 RepID=UPI00203BDC23|nr:hypothetical protein [Metabacillus litoralis]MCM3411458.1 hypothetical protein [Metabacillus litoralis]